MRTSSLALLTVLTAGCSANVVPSAEATDAEASASTSVAVVAVERSAVAGPAGDVARAEAVVRVVRARSGAVDEDALRMVGATLDVPALGACAPTAAVGRSAGRAVQLVDVGVVTLEAGGASTTLLPRRLPDVADLVSGIVYARTADGETMPARGRYDLRVAGTRGEAGFTVSATAPGDLSDVRVAGRDARSGLVSLAPNSPVDVTWEPGAAEDVVYVDVVAAAGALRCAFVDAAGHGTVAAASLAGMEEGTLAIHRLHREPFRGRVEAGEVRFDFGRVLAFTRR